MKYLFAFAILFLLTSFNAIYAQTADLTETELYGNWVFVHKTSDGYKLEDPCDKSEIIISRHFIIMAYEYEQHDTLFIKKTEISKGAVTFTFLPGKFNFSNARFYKTETAGIITKEIRDDKDRTGSVLTMHLARSADKARYNKDHEPCPDFSDPSFRIIRVE